jgi:hypothetical protein
MNENISKNTIIILVILTVTISLLGTWTVLHEVNNIKTQATNQEISGSSTGQIKLTMDPPDETSSTGQVALHKTQ